MTAATLDRQQSKTARKMESAPLRATANTASLSAVATKPRAKPTKKAVRAPALSERIACIRNSIEQADEKIQQAYDAAERGEPIDVLLDHIGHNLLGDAVRPIYRDELTRADVHHVYEALFVPLACLHAAMSISSGTVIHHSLVEAHSLLDQVQTDLDMCGDIAKALPEQQQCESDFIRGRDLAVAMLREGEARWNTDLSEPRRYNRLGVGFDNFSRAHLQVLIDGPELLDGFAAVMSAKCGVGDQPSAAYFELPQAEYEAGRPGADGTQRGDEDGSCSDEARICDAIANPPRGTPQSGAATTQAEQSTSQALLNGYNARQITTVQEQIATRAASLSESLRDLRDDTDTPQSTALYWSLNGAADMADMIGLLADAVAGGTIKGDAAAWLIGPNFAGEGRAAQT